MKENESKMIFMESLCFIAYILPYLYSYLYIDDWLRLILTKRWGVWTEMTFQNFTVHGLSNLYLGAKPSSSIYIQKSVSLMNMHCICFSKQFTWNSLHKSHVIHMKWQRILYWRSLHLLNMKFHFTQLYSIQNKSFK